jgi:hypothetical protein
VATGISRGDVRLYDSLHPTRNGRLSSNVRQRRCVSIHCNSSADHDRNSRCAVRGRPDRERWHENPLCRKPAQCRDRHSGSLGKAGRTNSVESEWWKYVQPCASALVATAASVAA